MKQLSELAKLAIANKELVFQNEEKEKLAAELAIANKKLADVDTIFLMADVEHTHINSSLIREIAYFGGPIEKFVPQEVAEALKQNS